MSPHRAHHQHGWSTRGNPQQGGPDDTPDTQRRVDVVKPTRALRFVLNWDAAGLRYEPVPVYDPGFHAADEQPTDERNLAHE